MLFKDTIFEPSSPSRHSAELANILKDSSVDYPVLFLYTDGGPDHRITYLSVKLTLIALFRYLDLDYLCACRTAPYHSFRNPAERIMSVLNLGLQSVGLARELVAGEEVEQEVSHCNSMSQVRELATKKPFIKEALIDSMAPVKVTLTDITHRLELKGEKFVVRSAAIQGDIAEVWGKLNEIDPAFTLSPNDKITHQKLTPNSYFVICEALLSSKALFL